jgi:hypothetical protein
MRRRRHLGGSRAGWAALREWLAASCFSTEEWWCRHVSQRELHRHLDAMRASFEVVWAAQSVEPPGEALVRLKVRIAELEDEMRRIAEARSEMNLPPSDGGRM